MIPRSLPSRVVVAVLCALMPLVASGCGGPESLEVEGTGDWTRWTVAKPEAFGGSFDLVYVNAVVPPATGGEPWTAVGYLVGTSGERRPKVWTSVDGLTWEAEDLPASPSGVRWDRPFKAARRGATTIVFGLKGEKGAEGAIGWYRTAPQGWSVVVNSGVGVPSTVEGLEASPEGIVGVGGAHFAETSMIGVVRTVTGVDWRTAFEIHAAPGERIDAFGYAAAGDREVVVGRSWPLSAPFENKEGAIWYATGTGGWERVPLEDAALAGPGYDAVQDVVPFAGGFVAVGIKDGPDDPRPYVWVSRDGVAWTPYEIEAVLGGISKVAVVGRQLVAIGRVESDARLAAWSSYDGRTWTRLELPDELSRFSQVEREDLVGGPNGEIAIVAGNDVESEVYIGRP